MTAKSLRLNPNVRVSSRNDFSEKSHTKYGDNFVGDFIATSGFAGPTIASGGTVTNYTVSGVPYISRTFTGSGTLTVVRGGKIGYLVVGGGAGGGYSHYGGGGGGGMWNSDNQAFGTYGKVIPKGGASYPVSVGAMNTPSYIGNGTVTTDPAQPIKQGNLDIYAYAGGHGAPGGPGIPGGSGGGAASAGEPINSPCHHGGSGYSGQGHPGGGGHCHNQCGYAPHGGGGGAGGSGAMGGAGGGRSSSVYDGTSRNYAGGGGNQHAHEPCYPPFGNAGGEYGAGNYGSGVVIIAHKG